MKHLIPVCLLSALLMCVMLASCGTHTHTPTTEIAAKTATCEEAGNTAKVVCSGCGEVLEESETIPALGHKWVLEELYIDKDDEVERAGNFCCDNCGSYEVRSVTYADIGLPIINVHDKEGSEKTLDQLISKADGEATVTFEYMSEELSYTCDASFKVQGSTAATLPKKNYTAKLLKPEDGKKYKVEMVDGWGKESKYCLKANYVDPSQARNVLSAQLYGQVLKTQGEDLKKELQKLINGGAIDGFPAMMFINGEFWGLYTFNIPKDKWQFGMDDAEKAEDPHQALLMADAWGDSIQLKEQIGKNEDDEYDYEKYGWELEYANNEELKDNDNTDWVAEGINALMAFIADNDEDVEAFRAGIGQYLDVDLAIDQMLFSWLFNGADNTSKNIIWVTYDGTLWFPSCYDMDGTWGMNWNGGVDAEAVTMTPATIMEKNYFWTVLYNAYKAEVVARYDALRTSVFTHDNIDKTFRAFFDQIKPEWYELDLQKWYNESVMKEVAKANAAVAAALDTEHNNYAQMIKYADDRLAALDAWFATQK